MVAGVEILGDSSKNDFLMKRSLMNFSLDLKTKIGDICHSSNLVLRQISNRMDESFSSKIRSSASFRSSEDLFRNHSSSTLLDLRDSSVTPMNVDHSYSISDDVDSTGKFDLDGKKKIEITPNLVVCFKS